MNIDCETLMEIEDYIKHLDETIGLKTETMQDIENAIEKYKRKKKPPTKPPTKQFNIHRKDFYQHDKPKDKTLMRLTEIAECGMSEVGIAQFGYEGILSGLYIEMVWNYSDEKFKDYMDWVKSLITKKTSQ